MLLSKRYTIVFLLILVAVTFWSCKSVMQINNSTDPKDFDRITLSAGSDTYYDEVSVDVPEDIRKEDYEITNVDIFADVTAVELNANISVKLYVGLQPGNVNMNNTAINEVIASAELSASNKFVKVEVRHSDLIYKAFDQETFWMKVTIEYDVPSETVIDVNNVYVDMQLERETGGLFPIFYLF